MTKTDKLRQKLHLKHSKSVNSDPKTYLATFLSQRITVPRITIAEIGARIISDENNNEPAEIFHTLPEARVIAFEPDHDACNNINSLTQSFPAHIQAYPYAVSGKCGRQTLYETNAGMCSSLYKPDEALMRRFMNLEVAYLKDTCEIDAITLDAFMQQGGIDEIDFIKIDVQGAELDVFRAATMAMPQLIGVCTEVEWAQLYENQPLFGDVDALLRQHGLQMHHFLGLSGRPIADTIFHGQQQVLWSDVVYFPSLQVVDTLEEDKLLKLAIMASMYDAHDLAQYALKRYDMLGSSRLLPDYVESFMKQFLNNNSSAQAHVSKETGQKRKKTTPAHAQNHARDNLTCMLPGGISIALPDDLNLMTPYVLQEQHDWFEDEIIFIRNLVQPGMHVIDIGANYGCYTLTMAKLIGKKGRLWAFEPASITAAFLKKSLKFNAFRNVRLLQCALSDHAGEAHLAIEGNAELNALVEDDMQGKHTETVKLERLDDCMKKYGWKNISFIKMDAEGEENHIIDGGRIFLEQCSPLIMFELKAGNQINKGLIQHFIDLDYQPYALVPGLSLLAPFDMQGNIDPYQLNLFCCKDDRAEILEQAGLLARNVENAGLEPPEGGHWQTRLKDLPYAKRLFPIWKSHLEDGKPLPGWPAYRKALNAYALAQNPDSPRQRLHYLQSAFFDMVSLLDEYATLPRMFSMARIAADMGRREAALNILNNIISQFEKEPQFIPDEPFLTVSAYAENIDPGDHLANWCFAQALAQRERRQAFSSYFTGQDSLPGLQMIRQLGFEDEDMRCRYMLIQKRFGLAEQAEQREQHHAPETIISAPKNSDEEGLPGTYATRTALLCDELSPELWRAIQTHCENVERGKTSQWLLLAIPKTGLQSEIHNYLQANFIQPYGGDGNPVRLRIGVQNDDGDMDTFMKNLSCICHHVQSVEPERSNSLKETIQTYRFLRPLSPIDNDKITICVPTYNRCKLLKRAVESVLAQTHKNFELIIMDDASSDGTEEYCRKLASEDGRIRYRQNPENIGIQANSALFLDMINTELFTLCADDDFLYPEHFEHAIGLFRQYPELGAVCNQWCMGNVAGEVAQKDSNYTTRCIIDPRQRMLDSIAGNHFFWSSSLVRYSAAERAAAYAREHFDMCRNKAIFGISDWFFGILLCNCVPIGYTPVPAAFYTVDPDTDSSRRLGGGWGMEYRLQAVRYIQTIYRHRFGHDIYLAKRLEQMNQLFRERLKMIRRELTTAELHASKEKLDEFAKLISELESTAAGD
jgi:FkbM family methyltransferase